VCRNEGTEDHLDLSSTSIPESWAAKRGLSSAVWSSRGCRDLGSSDITQVMRTRMSRVAAMIVLLTCVVRPVTEMFDYWES
jgi:hypothetical protein